MNRRSFLKKSALGIGSMLSFGAVSSLFAEAPAFDGNDYKALVVLQLSGGNDCFNTLVPVDSTQHQDYTSARPNIGINNLNLLDDASYTKDTSGYYEPVDYLVNPYKSATNSLEESYRKGSYHVTSEYGINAMMPEFASLYEKGVLSLVSNCAPLVKHVSKAEIAAGEAELPLFVFAHDHQQRALSTAIANESSKIGWLGRLSDTWSNTSAFNHPFGLNVSLAGINAMQTGRASTPLVIKSSLPRYDVNNTYIPSILRSFNGINHQNIFERIHKKLELDALNFADIFDTGWDTHNEYNAKNTYGRNLFTYGSGSSVGLPGMSSLYPHVFSNLDSVINLIRLGKDNLSYNRQVFYVTVGGFDTHDAINIDHPQKLRSISLAVSDFYKALEELGLEKSVLLANTSEFGRTLVDNGTGSDHGWGGHNFIVCGDDNFSGGNLLGTPVTDYKLTSDSFYPSSINKGRLIPTTSVEQMFAPILDWFGVDETTMEIVFPSLVNFRTNPDNYKSSFLEGMFT